MKFILTLHAVTDWNDPEAGRLQGQTDIPLNELGREQARELTDKILTSGLDSFGISKIVSSDLKRAGETAEIMRERISVPMVLDLRLRECRFGRLEGLSKLWLKGYEEYYQEKRSEKYDFSKFGGENRDQVFARHKACLDEILRTARGNAVIIVGHGRGLNTLIAGLGFEWILQRGEFRIIEYPR